MKKLKRITVGSAAVWVLTVVLVLLFPRQRDPAASTVFALLFWLSLFTTGFSLSVLIGTLRDRKKQKRKRDSAVSDSN